MVLKGIVCIVCRRWTWCRRWGNVLSWLRVRQLSLCSQMPRASTPLPAPAAFTRNGDQTLSNIDMRNVTQGHGILRVLHISGAHHLGILPVGGTSETRKGHASVTVAAAMVQGAKVCFLATHCFGVSREGLVRSGLGTSSLNACGKLCPNLRRASNTRSVTLCNAPDD